MISEKFKGYLCGTVSSASYGLIPLFAIPLMRRGMDIDSILSYRFMTASVVMAIMLLVRGVSLKVTAKELAVLALLGIMFSGSSQFLFLGYNYLSVGVASTILYIYPAFVALILYLFFKEKIPWITQLSILLAFLGVALLYLGDGVTGTLNLFGIVLILLSALSYGLYLIGVNKSLVKDMNGTKLTLYAMMFSAVVFTSKAFITDGGLQPFPDLVSIVELLCLAVVPTAVSGITMVYSVQYVGSTATAVLGAMEPVTALLVGIFAFSERFTINLAVGIVLIIVAVTLIVLADKIGKKGTNGDVTL